MGGVYLVEHEPYCELLLAMSGIRNDGHVEAGSHARRLSSQMPSLQTETYKRNLELGASKAASEGVECSVSATIRTEGVCTVQGCNRLGDRNSCVRCLYGNDGFQHTM